MSSITANELKTKGISAIEALLTFSSMAFCTLNKAEANLAIWERLGLKHFIQLRRIADR